MYLFALFSPFLGGRFVFHAAPLLFHLGFSTEFLAGLYPTRATLSKSLASFPRKPATIRYKVCMHSARMILYAVAALACVSPLSDTAFGFISSDWKKARILGVFGLTSPRFSFVFTRINFASLLPWSTFRRGFVFDAKSPPWEVDSLLIGFAFRTEFSSWFLVPTRCGRFPQTERKSYVR